MCILTCEITATQYQDVKCSYWLSNINDSSDKVRHFRQGVMVLRQHPFFVCGGAEHLAHLAAEAVQGPALPLQGIHHVKGCDSLAPSVLCVGDCIPDDILQEHLQTWQGIKT